MNQFASPLAKAKGLGSAKTGFDHWAKQRFSAVVLALAGLWFLIRVPKVQAYDALHQWIASLEGAVVLILFTIAMTIHGALGLQVIIEDYVHHTPAKLFLLFFSRLISLVMGIASVVAIFKIIVM